MFRTREGTFELSSITTFLDPVCSGDARVGTQFSSALGEIRETRLQESDGRDPLTPVQDRDFGLWFRGTILGSWARTKNFGGRQKPPFSELWPGRFF